MANQYVSNIIDAIAQIPDDGSQLSRVRTLAAELSWADEDEIDFLLEELAKLLSDSSEKSLDASLEIVVGRLLNDLRGSQSPSISAQRLELLTDLYTKLPVESRVRSYVLGWMGTVDQSYALQRFTKLIVDDPPQSVSSIVIAFAPLVEQSRELPIDTMFPLMLDGLQHLSVAAAILDLANFLTRHDRVGHHPASSRTTQLMKTLEMLTDQLARLEQGQAPPNAGPDQISQMVNESVSLITSLCDALALIGSQQAPPNAGPDQISQMVNESVSLITSLCDALALIGSQQAIEPLKRTAELRHRRIRTEALSALCQLGDPESSAKLVALAAEPIARIRVLAYADELDLIDEIPDQYQTDEARAESELAMWLAHPSNMGVPPTSQHLMDSRRLMWPSYDDPVDCFLFRYQYKFGDEQIENVGIAGPLTHAFAIPITNLSLADIYACFAGWQCTHQDIVELSIEQARAQKPGSIERLMARLANESTEGSSLADVEPCFLGLFMGEEVLVATCKKETQTGTYVVDARDVAWFDPMNESTDGMDELAYCIYKGRKILGAFNTPDDWPGDA